MSQHKNEMSDNARRFSSFMGSFAGNLSEEQVESDPRAAQEQLQQRISTEQLSGAQGLLAHQVNKKNKNNKNQGDALRIKREALDRAHAQQADTQEKMKILMQNPQLWLQFKSRLAVSNHGGGSIGVTTVLQEFLVDHPEIEDQWKREQEEAAQRLKDARGVRRISILETVSNLTSELSGETRAPRSGSMGFNSSFQIQQRRTSNGSVGSYELSSSSSAPPTPSQGDRQGFMGSATEIGMSFLKRASNVASASLQGSQTSMNSEGLDSSSGGGSRYERDESARLNDAKQSGRNLAAFDEYDEDGYVTSDDEGGIFDENGLEENLVDLTIGITRKKNGISRAA